MLQIEQNRRSPGSTSSAGFNPILQGWMNFYGIYTPTAMKPIWSYVNATAHTLLVPLKKIPLRMGKVDFAPVAGLALTFFAAEQIQKGLVWLYGRAPF